MAKKNKIYNLNKNLITPFESDTTSSWDEYPRPSLVRDSYLCLNGEWELSAKNGESVEKLAAGMGNSILIPRTWMPNTHIDKFVPYVLAFKKKYP